MLVHGQVIISPCVQYFDGGCTSMVFPGMEILSVATRHR